MSSGSHDITVFTIDAGGKLVHPRTVALGQGHDTSRAMALHPKGQAAYVAWFFDVGTPPSGGLLGYAITPQGDLGKRTDWQHMGVHPRAMAVAPSGQFVYVPESGAGIISPEGWFGLGVSIYMADASTGTLLRKVGKLSTDAQKERDPQSIAVDPASEKFVYVANRGSDTVSMYAMTATGELTSLGPPVPAGGEPIWVTVDSSGQFVYVANHGTNNVSMYTITPGSGTLMPRGTVPAGVHPWWVTVAPSGQFVYVANASSPDAQGNPVGDVSMYEITGTGTLRPLGTVRAGKGPVAVTTKEVLV